MSILIQNASALSPQGLPQRTSIAIEGARITRIAPALPTRGVDMVIDAQGQLALPGLVNAHTHLAMVLLRGYADDMALQPWLQEKIWPAEAKLTAEQVYWASLWGCAELIKGGVTAFCDMYFFMDEVAKAVEQTGLRALLSYGMIAPKPDDKVEREVGVAEAFAERWHGRGQGRIQVALAPHAQYTCCDRLWERTLEVARARNLRINTHLCETRKEVELCRKEHGKSPVAYLNQLGAFEAPTVAAHCVHVDGEDIDILASKGVFVSHNPGSNLKLGSGVAPLPKLLEAGVTVALGTDGAASNNNLNLFEEMQLAALLHKGIGQDPLAVPAPKAFELATRNGYLALGVEGGGALAEGALADVILVESRQAHLEPLYCPLSALVYSAQAADVTTTIVNGRLLMKERNLLTIDEAHVRGKVNEMANFHRR